MELDDLKIREFLFELKTLTGGIGITPRGMKGRGNSLPPGRGQDRLHLDNLCLDLERLGSNG